MSHFDTAALEQSHLNLAADMLQSESAIRLRVRGASMLPALWPGDLLTIDPVPCAAVRTGEIVLYVRKQRVVIHRLVHVGGTSGVADWITRGDALPDRDPAVPAEAILGRVSSITRGGRTLVPGRPTVWGRILAWIFCRSDLLCRLALQIHALRQAFWTRHGLGGPLQVSPAQRVHQ
jgi:signal peptidase I